MVHEAQAGRDGEGKARLHRVPDAGHTIGFGLSRTTPENTPAITFESGQYSVRRSIARLTTRGRRLRRAQERQRYASGVVTVSVVIPSFNSEILLRRAVASVLAQTMDDLEIVIVDDGSTHPPVTVPQMDARVHLVCQQNRGVSVARNVGVTVAEGEFIAFLDQDDEWLPLKLEQQLAHVAANPTASFWCTGFDWVTPDSTTPSYTVQLTYRGLLRTQSVILSTTLIRQSDYWAKGGHDPLLLQMQDWDLFLRLAADGDPPAMLDERLVKYHLHGFNTSHNYRLAARERLAILESHERRAKVRGDSETVRAVTAGRKRTRELFAQKAIDATRSSLRSSENARALEHLSFAARLSPSAAARAIAVSVLTQARRALTVLRDTAGQRS